MQSYKKNSETSSVNVIQSNYGKYFVIALWTCPYIFDIKAAHNKPIISYMLTRNTSYYNFIRALCSTKPTMQKIELNT